MNEELFRKKNIDRMNSPESLNDYIRASNPSVWLILTALIAMLVGLCVWGIFGQIETTVITEAAAKNGIVTCSVVNEEINASMPIRIGDREYEISDIDFSGNIGRRVCDITAEADIPDGLYQAEIVTERIRPISFLLN